MALKRINEDPKTTDTILLEIETPDANGCFDDDPYKVDKVTIYYIERDFLGENFGEYDSIIAPDDLMQELKDAKKTFCDNPTQENLDALKAIQTEVSSAAKVEKFYYKDRVAVKVVGQEGFPAWIGTDEENSPLIHEVYDEDGNVQYGRFTYEWNPNGSIRAGDFFVCWTWSPLVSGEKLSAHFHFVVHGDQNAVITIPSHLTPPEKYEVLCERFLPEVYKTTLSDQDVTPEVTDQLNKSIAKGFTFVEDFGNQIIDLLDANALTESLLPYLSNTFALRLKSNDPTLWRRQIKEATNLYKKKGTLQGLKDAFAQAGMVLNSYVQYWQLVSPYTWVDEFLATDSPVFNLTKTNIVTPIDDDNFGLWIKRSGETTYTELTKDYVSFDYADDGTLQMTWIGDGLSAGSVDLFQGDYIKVKYQYNEIPGGTEQGYEDYIQTLPLSDQRDENDQLYPLKNWNVRLIEETDTLFNTLVPVRQPFYDPVRFGYIRTDFAYSENIYNMEEYNGSVRPSFNPCNIDKNFLDPCGACLSSTYSVDIGIEELSNDRILEAQDILSEYTPFHAQVYSISFTGEANEFVQSPEESVTTLITISHPEFVMSGNANPFFHRGMEDATTSWIIDRSDLADKTTVLSGKLGTAYNDHVAFVSPNVPLNGIGLSPLNHVLEVLSPSMNAGTYTIQDMDTNTARVTSAVNEPVDGSAFTFNLANINYGNFHTTITQDDLVILSDEDVDFAEIGVKTEWDVDNTPDYTGGSWKVLISAYSATPYNIREIINGKLILAGDSNLPTVDTTGISYVLKDDDDNVVETSTTGVLEVTRRGYVNLNDGSLVDIENYIRPLDYLLYNGDEYLILAFDGSNFWIDGYTDGAVAGATIKTKRYLAEGETGYFGYRGLKLISFADHEAEFDMINGDNPPTDQPDNSHFKENFLFVINDEYYKIVEIDGINVTLSGRDIDWTTLSNGGTVVAYSIIHLEKTPVDVNFIVFDQLDRNGKDPVIREVYSDLDQSTTITALSTSKNSGIEENVSQEEGVSIIIEYKDGSVFEGDL
jgi:hypothetical protein